MILADLVDFIKFVQLTDAGLCGQAQIKYKDEIKCIEQNDYRSLEALRCRISCTWGEILIQFVMFVVFTRLQSNYSKVNYLL